MARRQRSRALLRLWPVVGAARAAERAQKAAEFVGATACGWARGDNTFELKEADLRAIVALVVSEKGTIGEFRVQTILDHRVVVIRESLF